MPKEGYESLTISKELHNKISEFTQASGGIVSSKTQAITQAWQIYENLFLENKNPKPVAIGNKLVGHNQPVFVIAEIGINHNGDMDICKKLIDMAADTGCDAVKFQKRTIEKVYSKAELEKPRESPFGTTNGHLKRGLEFGTEEFKEIDEYCKQKGIMWFASPWDTESVDFLEKFPVPCHKIPSALLTHKELLLKIKDTKKPIILSTGMSTLDQIKKAVDILGEENLIMMHCTSTYPTPKNEHNLNTIKRYRKYFNCPIGYSGHESGVWPTVVAASIGACILERHITLDRTMFGSDQASSLEKKGMEIICNIAKSVPELLGDGNKIVYESEKGIIPKLRRVDDLG
ncbi:MAG: N-acetylneuraminate synthase family protein [archaeon]